MTDPVIELVLRALTQNFDTFISECIDENGKPKAPTVKALMQARACLQPTYVNAFQPKKRS